MTNITYNVNIAYTPLVVNGWTQSFAAGATHTVQSYSGGYFIASMPEVALYGTGSSYTSSLASLLAIAASASGNYNSPYSIRG